MIPKIQSDKYKTFEKQNSDFLKYRTPKTKIKKTYGFKTKCNIASEIKKIEQISWS